MIPHDQPPSRIPPWRKPTPKGGGRVTLTEEFKNLAAARAAKAGRPYPNLIDNMWAAREQAWKKKA